MKSIKQVLFPLVLLQHILYGSDRWIKYALMEVIFSTCTQKLLSYSSGGITWTVRDYPVTQNHHSTPKRGSKIVRLQN